MTRSLRSRLLLGAALSTTLVLAASGVTLYLLVRRSLFRELDHALASKARALSALVEIEDEEEERLTLAQVPAAARAAILKHAGRGIIQEIERKTKHGRTIYEVEVIRGGRKLDLWVPSPEPSPAEAPVKIELEFGERDLPEFQRAERPEYLQLWSTSGKTLYRSRSLGSRDLERVAGPPDAPACRSVALPDGRRGRSAGITFAPRQDHGGPSTAHQIILVLARDTQDIDKALAGLSGLLVGVCAGATLVSVGLLAWIVKRGLRPVERLAAQIGSVGEADLSARITLDDAPEELAPVVERLNDLLARLAAAFDRERAFSADVAHELRTPLAGLRATLEVGLSRERAATAYRRAMSECLVICCQMHTMVENLLSLARTEAGRLDLACEPVRLDEALRQCWHPLAEQARARELHVGWQVEQPCVVETDPDKLRLILRNILENAVTYANVGGHVRIESSSRDGRIELSVANSGSELTQEQAAHVFERFWRGDAARAATGVHCGLGLALCEKLIALLGGSIAAHSAPGGQFILTLAFDAAQHPEGANTSAR